MLKETIICIVIVISIIIGNNITKNYTSESIQEISEVLLNIKDEIFNEKIENKKVEEEIKKIEEQWNERHTKLAFYIEHNELEKIETGITSMKSYIETEKYEESINEIDKSVFLLKHIKDKYSFNLQNIF